MNRVVIWATMKTADAMTGDLLKVTQGRNPPGRGKFIIALTIVYIAGLWYGILEKLGVNVE